MLSWYNGHVEGLRQRPSDLQNPQFLLSDSFEKVCQNPLMEPAVYQQIILGFFFFLINTSPVSCNEGQIVAIPLPSRGESDKLLLVLEA